MGLVSMCNTFGVDRGRTLTRAPSGTCRPLRMGTNIQILQSSCGGMGASFPGQRLVACGCELRVQLGGSLEPFSLCCAVFHHRSTKAQARVDPRSARMPSVPVWPPVDPDATTPMCHRKMDGVPVAEFPLRSCIMGFTRGRHTRCNDD